LQSAFCRLLDIGTVATSHIGTLFAFVLVAIGVLVLRYREPNRHRHSAHPAATRASHDDSYLHPADGRSSNSQWIRSLVGWRLAWSFISFTAKQVSLQQDKYLKCVVGTVDRQLCHFHLS